MFAFLSRVCLHRRAEKHLHARYDIIYLSPLSSPRSFVTCHHLILSVATVNNARRKDGQKRKTPKIAIFMHERRFPPLTPKQDCASGGRGNFLIGIATAETMMMSLFAFYESI